ncbi:hypothetical protein ACFY93_22170 [Streptomyces sp. NPDC008313]|uniref:hypothetical protein n=1 Tax=Streptomyces sp. NPDC008313 TaxID=3364826 RepID=UPI0036E4D06C
MSIGLSLVGMIPECLAKYMENVNGDVRTSGSSGAIWEPTRSPSPFEATRDHDSLTL